MVGGRAPSSVLAPAELSAPVMLAGQFASAERELLVAGQSGGGRGARYRVRPPRWCWRSGGCYRRGHAVDATPRGEQEW
jgi:hypothetical protein